MPSYEYQVAAIGDSENDRQMLGNAGLAISIGESLSQSADHSTKKLYGKGGKRSPLQDDSPNPEAKGRGDFINYYND